MLKRLPVSCKNDSCHVETTPCIMQEWLLSCRNDSHLRKVFRSGFRLGIILHTKNSYFPPYGGKKHSGMGFFFWGGRDCFLVVAGNASGALHQVRSALLLNWLLRHRKLPPTCINRTIIVCRKHSRVVFTLEYLTLRLFLWCEDVKVKNRRCKDLGKTLCHQWLGERDGEQSYQQTSITSSHSVCLSCTVLMDLFNVLRYKSGQVVVFLSETDMMNTGLWRDSCLSVANCLFAKLIDRAGRGVSLF